MSGSRQSLEPDSPEFFERLERVFHELIELESRARDHALEGLRSRDPALGERLDSLLKVHLRATEVETTDIQSIPMRPSADVPSADDAAGDGSTSKESIRRAVDPLLSLGRRVRNTVEDIWSSGPQDPKQDVGRKFGAYELLRPIGVGGMGTVYEALQQNPRRKVALKVMPAGVASRSSLRRFEIETEVLARLQHPGIASIFDAGIYRPDLAESQPLESDSWSNGKDEPLRTEDLEARPYFAMELVKGVPFSSHVAQLPIERRLQAFVKVCEAIHYAHTKGVIHRDLKPANILVDQRGRPKVLDFGVARLADSEQADSTTLKTAHGQILGTVQYMSPEQASGDPDAVDTRTDVYSLGVILFEALAGELPYQVDRRGLHDAIRVIREQEPTRLGWVVPRLRGTDLEVIVAKALEKDRELRYQSVLDLASDCIRFLRDEPIEARSPNALHQLGRFARRNRALLVGVVATVVGLSVGLIGLLLGVISAGRAGDGLVVSVGIGLAGLTLGVFAARRALLDLIRQRDLAASAAATASVEASKAATIRGFLETFFTAGLPNRARGRTVTVREAVDLAAEQINVQLAGNPEVQAWANDLIGMSYSPLGELERAEFHLRTAVRMRRGLLGADHPDTLESSEHLARVLVDAGRSDEAETLARQTMEARSRSDGVGAVLTLHSVSTLSRALHAQHKVVEAETLLREAVFQGGESLGAEHPQLLAVRSDLAVVCIEIGRFAEAETILREVYAAREAQFGERHTDTLESQVNLASVLHHRQEFEEASELLNQALIVQEEICGSDHPETLSTLETLADMYRKSDRLYLAAFLYEKLDSALADTHDGQHPWRLRAMIKLGSSYLHQERFSVAVSVLSRALGILERAYPEGRPETVTVLTNLGFAYHRSDSPERAVEWFERAVTEAYRLLPPDDPRVMVIEANFAACLIGMGEHDRAGQLLERCYASLGTTSHPAERIVPRIFRQPLGNLTELHEAWVEQTNTDPFEDLADETLRPRFSS